MKEKKEFKVTAEGSLGILALGAVGIRLWRQAKEEKEKTKGKTKRSENGKTKN
ncbi:MAG: hypothetical protein RIT43_339 [Bacteroidota bacterium]|jgi:hypothetical protein